MITRAQIRRQLRKNGGIMNTVPRQNYGLGSKLKDRFRKLIPNELANVASKAAPFVAPFFPGAAAAMRGIGRFDKRGSISDAMKQAALTYAGGKGARYLGGVDKSLMPGKGTTGFDYSMDKFREGPIGRTWDRMMPERQVTDNAIKTGYPNPNLDVIKSNNPVKGIWNKFQGMSPGMRTAIVGVGSGAIAGVAQWFSDQVPQEPGESMEEYMVRRKATVGKLMRTYMDNYYAYDSEYSVLDDAGKDEFVARYNVAQGGRVGFANGSPHFDPPTFSEGVPQMFMSDELGALPKAEGGVSPEDMGILSIDDFDNVEDYRRYTRNLPETDKEFFIKNFSKPSTLEKDLSGKPQLERGNLIEQELQKMLKKLIAMRERGMINKNLSDEDLISTAIRNVKGNYLGEETQEYKPENLGLAKGGRIGKYGGGIGAAMPRIPTGMPRVNAGGISELDYRAKGGFVPVGVKEKADDVPAMLSKNEFVMTADAVRAAGGGSVEKGAQKMYNTMKQLEGRIA